MDRWEFFQDSRGLWRWRRTSADGNVVLNSAEAYPRRVQAVAEALAHGFVEDPLAVDSGVTREIHPTCFCTSGIAAGQVRECVFGLRELPDGFITHGIHVTSERPARGCG